MNKYELAVVVSAKLEDDERAATIEKVKNMVTKHGGTITNVDEWGKKRLAYEVRKKREAFYYFIQFDGESTVPAEIESRIRLMENVVRYLCVRQDEKQSTHLYLKQYRLVDGEPEYMNKVVLMGRLTRDPEVRYTQGENQMAIARYTLAVDRRYNRGNDENTADFIPCVAFGKAGEFAEKYFRKGTKIAVSGRIQTGSYTNKDGVKVYTTEVIVDDQEFAESKSNSSNSDGNYGSGFGGSGSQSAAPMSAGDGFMNIPDGIDEELPFN